MADAARGHGSLPVANVQALAETCNNGVDEPVPQRYLSKDPSAEEVVAADDSSHAIPVIDFRKLLDPESSEEECARLGSACHHWGFFQVRTGSTNLLTISCLSLYIYISSVHIHIKR